ncbi:MAG: hypothetical protein MHM6MM_006618 [Cercozoa sp. M6MM]
MSWHRFSRVLGKRWHAGVTLAAIPAATPGTPNRSADDESDDISPVASFLSSAKSQWWQSPEQAWHAVRDMEGKESMPAGALTGYCCGYAVGKLGRIATFTLGVCFLGLQALHQAGYLQMNWGKVAEDTVAHFDQNGDGVLDSNDASIAWKRTMVFLQPNLPGAAAFAPAFLLGLRRSIRV